jgi:hypothetical protein
MKKLPITKEAFEKSRYFNDKYGKLEYVSESGKVFKTNKGKVLKFKESSGTMDYEMFKARFNSIMDDLYGLLSETNAPEDVWIDDFDVFKGSIEENVGEYLDDPVDEGTESNPRFKCMENRRSKRR